MKLRVIILAAAVTASAVTHARASTPIVPGGGARESRHIGTVADSETPPAIAVPAAEASGVASWALMLVVLGLTGAKRTRKGRTPHHF